MPFNGSGIYSPMDPPDFPAVAGTVIRAAQYNNQINDMATALSLCLIRNGDNAMEANLNFGGNKAINVADPEVAGDALVFAADGTLANVTITGDLRLSGVGKRIKANFTAASHTNHTMFQNVSGSMTAVAAIPGVGSVGAGWRAYQSEADFTLTRYAALEIDGTSAKLRVVREGEALPASGVLEILVDDFNPMTIGGTWGQVIVHTPTVSPLVVMGESLPHFPLNLGNNFSITVTSDGELEFLSTEYGTGQSGTILFNNPNHYTITKVAAVKCGALFLPRISSTGMYRISYFCDGVNTYCTSTEALS